MKKLKSIRLILFAASAIFFGCSMKKPPTDNAGLPLIVKIGTIDCDLVETTPVVFKDKVYRFEYVRAGYWNNHTGDSYFRFIDHQTGKPTASFAKGFHFGSAFVFDNTAIVTAVEKGDGERVFIFVSHDLENWEQWVAFDLPGFGIFNTSLIKADTNFVLMFEVGKPLLEAGERFTARFATSPDLKKWEILSRDHNYAMDRYTAPHCLRFCDGYFYDFYLEAYQGYQARVVRSKDLIHWEPSPLNPVLKASAIDRQLATRNLPDSLKQKIILAENCNNSDIDFCEYRGELIINYSWGNQRGKEFLGEAVYKGTQEQFLKGWFPPK